MWPVTDTLFVPVRHFPIIVKKNRLRPVFYSLFYSDFYSDFFRFFVRIFILFGFGGAFFGAAAMM